MNANLRTNFMVRGVKCDPVIHRITVPIREGKNIDWLLHRCWPEPVIRLITTSALQILFIIKYKKLIRRWDSERELSLRRHRTCATKHCHIRLSVSD